MKRRIGIIAVIMMLVLPIGAQQIAVDDFQRLKRTWLMRLFGHPAPVDKKMAILALEATEKGFTFKAQGQTDVKPEEKDGVITLKIPDKTDYLVIKHPKYGEVTWKVPNGKKLRKKKHYRAILSALDKDHKLPWQWVTLVTSPKNVIVQIDSTTHLVRDGIVAVRLQTDKKHGYRVEAPFYVAKTDSFMVDSVKLTLNVNLQPAYSYLTVTTPWKDGTIYIDGQPVGKAVATSMKLQAGLHRIIVGRDSTCYYDGSFDIQPAEKKELSLTEKDAAKSWLARLGKPASKSNPMKAVLPVNALEGAVGMANVSGNVVGAYIYIDNVYVGKTPCVIKGLPVAKEHVICLKKAGYADARQTVHLNGTGVTEVTLNMLKLQNE